MTENYSKNCITGSKRNTLCLLRSGSSIKEKVIEMNIYEGYRRLELNWQQTEVTVLTDIDFGAFTERTG